MAESQPVSATGGPPGVFCNQIRDDSLDETPGLRPHHFSGGPTGLQIQGRALESPLLIKKESRRNFSNSKHWAAVPWSRQEERATSPSPFAGK